MTTSLVVAGFLSLFGAPEDQPDSPAGSVAPLVVTGAVAGAVTDAVTGFQDDAAAAAAVDAVDEGPKLPHWSGTVDVAIIQKQGNTESLNGNLASKIVREAKPSRTTIRSWWLYESESGDVTERRYGTLGKYDWFLTEKKRNYLYGLASIGTDYSANIRSRYYSGGGVGRVWWDNETVRFSSDVGATYLHEKYRDDETDGKANWSGIYELKWVLNEKMNYDSGFIGQMAMGDTSDILLTWRHMVDWDIGWNFRAGMMYVLEWNNSPEAGSKRDDNILTFTLGWKFGED